MYSFVNINYVFIFSAAEKYNLFATANLIIMIIQKVHDCMYMVDYCSANMHCPLVPISVLKLAFHLLSKRDTDKNQRVLHPGLGI